MMFDLFWFLLIDFRDRIVGFPIRMETPIQFRLERLRIAMLGTLNE